MYGSQAEKRSRGPPPEVCEGKVRRQAGDFLHWIPGEETNSRSPTSGSLLLPETVVTVFGDSLGMFVDGVCLPYLVPELQIDSKWYGSGETRKERVSFVLCPAWRFRFKRSTFTGGKIMWHLTSEHDVGLGRPQSAWLANDS